MEIQAVKSVMIVEKLKKIERRSSYHLAHANVVTSLIVGIVIIDDKSQKADEYELRGYIPSRSHE